ncbi:MAG: hypothetical protein FJ087_21850, partial [Deltaproteobacteria bacterium]|nr:hypothetical protein [Deltaproteobacteria bacterium]
MLLTSAPAARADGPAVNVQRFDPSPHAGDLLSVRTAEQVEGRWWSFGLFATHARRPLTIRDETPGQETQYDLVLDRTDLEVMGAVALWGRLSVGLALPIVAVDRGDSGFPGVPAASGGGIGDLKLAPKVLILPRRTRGFGLGFETVLTFPTATARYAGDGWSGTPRVIVDGRIGDTTIAFNTGMRFREGVRLGLFETSHEFLAALGARQGFWKDRVQLLAELGAATQVNDFFSRNGTSLEGQLGADICVADAVRIYVAAGKGFVSGLGDSQFRVTAGARMEPCGPSAHPIPVEVAAAPAPAEPAPPVPVPGPVPEPKPEPAAEAEPAPVAAAPVPVPEPKPEPAPAPAPEPQGPPPASPRAAALPPPRPAGGESDGRAGGGPAPKPAPRPLPPPPPTPVPPVGKGQCPAGREAGPLG